MEGPIGFPFLIKEIDDAMSVVLGSDSVFVDRLIDYTVIGYCRFSLGDELKGHPKISTCQVLCTPNVSFINSKCFHLLRFRDIDRDYRWRVPHGLTLIRSCFSPSD